ncbi:glycosyltransferase family 22 protein [Lentinula lateritia]|uniref:Glycosyltransferase family 22 protein n=1 Tax=Lentinula aff. lateritia TaxID=2804960 RepID=A0ACC1U1X6_9AGAR|nr:glycosyltransferase family 22 protein [Lentinula aff. lateritia]KAJ3854625.1 glycosyltransferase family 22 protein [Lentinula lateritia]
MLFLTTTVLAFVIRIFIALCTRTVFQPDEYFQALEPAHQIVFGYGHLTWEWLSPQPIRSIVYPALNVPIYWILKQTGLDSYGRIGDFLMVNSPRVLHGSFAALTDIWLCKLTRRTIGGRYESSALLLSLTSLFHALSLSRSLSNSLETSLTTIALTYYPWDGFFAAQTRSDIQKMLFFAAMACSVRITNAIIWAFLLPSLFWRMRSNSKLLIMSCFDIAIIGGVTLGIIFVLDTIYYAQPTFTPFSFLVTNLSGVSLFYGNSPWHYYLSQALPILCTTSLPFVLDGIWSTIYSGNPALQTLLGVIVWTIGVYSLAGHKEWRFIHPLLPILHVLAAKSLVERSSHKVEIKEKFNSQRIPIRRAFLGLLLVTLPISAWIVFVHCSGPLSVMSYIRRIPENELRGGVVGFLMPCHSTPGHAYLHRPQLANGGLWALGCEPPLNNQNLSAYRDQTKIFFANPHQYLLDRFPNRVNPVFPKSPHPASIPGQSTSDDRWLHEWPRYLVCFGALLEEHGVKEHLVGRGYEEVWKSGRSWEGDSDTRKGGVRIWKWREKS